MFSALHGGKHPYNKNAMLLKTIHLALDIFNPESEFLLLFSTTNKKVIHGYFFFLQTSTDVELQRSELQWSGVWLTAWRQRGVVLICPLGKSSGESSLILLQLCQSACMPGVGVGPLI